MARTSHGHRIPFSPDDGNINKGVMRCGGPMLCQVCSRESSTWAMKNEKKEKVMTLEVENYQLKPNPVVAIQITNENIEEVAAWCNGQFVKTPTRSFIDVPALEGFRRATVDEWIVKDGKDHFYPLHDFTFKRRYEKVQKAFAEGEGLFE